MSELSKPDNFANYAVSGSDELYQGQSRRYYPPLKGTVAEGGSISISDFNQYVRVLYWTLRHDPLPTGRAEVRVNGSHGITAWGGAPGLCDPSYRWMYRLIKTVADYYL